MNWFTDLSTRAKLFYGFGAMWVLLAVVILTAYLGITKITRSEITLRDRYFEEALELRQLQANQNFNRGRILEMILDPDQSNIQTIAQEVQELSRQNDKIIENLSKIDPDAMEQGRLTELQNVLALYRRTREQIMTLIREGKTDEAKQFAVNIQEERFNKIKTIVDELGTKASWNVDKQIADDLHAANMGVLVFGIVGAAAILLGSLLIVILNKIMARPLVQLAGVAESIAAGDLTVAPASGGRRDEVGRLMESFDRMTQSLRSMADVAEQIAAGNLSVKVASQSEKDVLGSSFARMTRSLRAMAGLAERIAAGDLSVAVTPQSEQDILGASFARMVENLRRSLADISDAVNVLGSSSGEILSATTQVASSTSETAAAIGETTATVEEVRQAAQLSAQKAQNVSDSAKRVAQVSQTGREAVEETAAGMGRIRDQMESIARTIVRLSEQGQSIGGIIASVTDLADQSNLLAVNAAIEAARAGEQGRGFAVVANEIESLAEQSKQATAQVREILNDLQKATGAAVMATEQGSKAVEAGVTQSSLAGAAIKALADSSEEAAQMAMQIAASSQQQVVGMNQIGSAMENINQAGAETVTSMKQSEEAARGLHELGRKLKQLVEQYKV